MKKFMWTGSLLVWGILAAAILAYPAIASSLAQSAQEGETIFNQQCASCHTIGGGKLVGPDLQGVTSRRDLAWLRSFIANPSTLIDSGDPVATQLLAEYNNLRMPSFGLNDTQVSAVLAYLENPGTAPQAVDPLAGLPAGGAQAGALLFSGEKRLANGGAPCIACHTVEGAGFVAGGSLGPDLTQVLQRYGEAGLVANLNQITFPTMQGPFLNKPLTPQEQADLVAFFTTSNAQAPIPARPITTLFLGAGALGALLLFGVLFVFWPRQRESLASQLRRGKTGRKRALSSPRA